MCPLIPVMPEAVHRSLHYHVQSVAYIVVGVVYILAPSVDAHSTYMLVMIGFVNPCKQNYHCNIN